MRDSPFIINVTLLFPPANASRYRALCMRAPGGRCDNRDKLDDNAIPISEIDEEREEREREITY